MPLTIEEVRRRLTEEPSKDNAEILKGWRAQMAYSQVEAAIRLGVPLRTLQGWELGRPMLYPALLQRAVPKIADPIERFALSQADFPREFAEFIDFVGASVLDKELRVVEQRLNGLIPTIRAIYRDRYFFQEECLRFVDNVPVFGLNIADPNAVRMASLIAGVNRIRRLLSTKARRELRSRVIDGLGRDIRHLEHEVAAWMHFARKGFTVTFPDLEGLGRFDLLVETATGRVAVECKTMGEDTGEQFKAETLISIAKIFERASAKLLSTIDTGEFILTLKKAADHCKNLPRQLEDALKVYANKHHEGEDFSLTFVPKPSWQELLNNGATSELERQMQHPVDSEKFERMAIGVITPQKVLGLTIQSDSPTRFRRNLVQILKKAADQCPNDGASAVWLHFVGMAEASFRTLYDLSVSDGGAGLNGVVADVLHPDASKTDRSHVQRVLFSAQSGVLRPRPMLDANLILIRTVVQSTNYFEVPNPRSKFMPLVEI